MDCLIGQKGIIGFWLFTTWVWELKHQRETFYCSEIALLYLEWSNEVLSYVSFKNQLGFRCLCIEIEIEIEIKIQIKYKYK